MSFHVVGSILSVLVGDIPGISLILRALIDGNRKSLLTPEKAIRDDLEMIEEDRRASEDATAYID